MKHKRRSTEDAGPTFYVVAIAPERDIASSVIQLLRDAGLVATGGEGSRHWGFPIFCTDFEHVRAAITARMAYRTGDMDLFVLTHSTRADEGGHRDDLADLAAFRKHMMRRWELSLALIAEPDGAANGGQPLRSPPTLKASEAGRRR